MLKRIFCRLVFVLCGALVWAGCAKAWQPSDFAGLELQPGRYLHNYYRSPGLDPAAAVYEVGPFAMERVAGLSQEQASRLFNEELVQAMEANGLRVRGEKPELIINGRVARFAVASPFWRFFSGRGHADLRVEGEVRQGQEVVFAFQDQVSIAPPVNPRHRPALEPELIARQAARRFAKNFLNELLLPPDSGPGENPPTISPPAH
ncbi:MAG: hypothetical protein FJ135_02795 [Deltaproteobacteria bacterium]|nr:hypothetical protein [Deltaproteobacteria bacterium]